jgi:hypothetical protein
MSNATKMQRGAEHFALARSAVTVVALVASLKPTAHAEHPQVVYDQVYSRFGTLHPQDIAVDRDGNAYVLAARWGSNYATFS